MFHYNKTFGVAPSNDSEQAWSALFPAHGGFFQHPSIAPERSAFSVFHQLHCLVRPPSEVGSTRLTVTQKGLRDNYWAVHKKAELAQMGKRHEGHGDHGAPLPEAHVRHCIDLLRNSLMCRPDLTIEKKDHELEGVTGFGTEHACVNWSELVSWTSEWEEWVP